MGQAALPLALVGSSLLGGITAPEGQELGSFETDEDRAAGIAPSTLLTDARGSIEQLMNYFTSQMNSPISSTSVAPSLPSFVGGGLPFAISAPAQDQAIANPRVLTNTPSTQLGQVIRPSTSNDEPGAVQRRPIQDQINERFPLNVGNVTRRPVGGSRGQAGLMPVEGSASDRSLSGIDLLLQALQEEPA